MARLLDRLTYTQPEAAQVLGVSARTVKHLMDCGDLPVMTIGNRRLISRHALEEWVAAHAGDSFPSRPQPKAEGS